PEQPSAGETDEILQESVRRRFFQAGEEDPDQGNRADDQGRQEDASDQRHPPPLSQIAAIPGRRRSDTEGLPEDPPYDDVHRFLLRQSPGHQRLDLFLVHAPDGRLVRQFGAVVGHEEPRDGADARILPLDDLYAVDVAPGPRSVPDRFPDDLADAMAGGDDPALRKSSRLLPVQEKGLL